MKLKNNLLALVMLCLLFAAPASAFASNSKPANENPKELTEEQRARLQTIERRVAEIKSMDKSTLTKAERKELRKELKDMKKEAKALSGGVYISIGALLVVILLLILLL
jgi:septal ring factor EnvC (AmiA/AmiB activator)